MVNKPKAIGTAGETGVCRFLRDAGFPHVERRALTGSSDQGDIAGIPGVCVEVKSGAAAKSASLGQIADWMVEAETERVNARADVAVLVVQRRGVAPARAGLWRAVFPAWAWAALHGLPAGGCAVPAGSVEVTLADAAMQLRAAGYGEPLLAPISLVPAS